MPMGMYGLLALAHVVFEFIEPPTRVEACTSPAKTMAPTITAIKINAQVSFLMFPPHISGCLKI